MGKARDLANLLTNGLVAPTKLSAGAPTWNAASSVGIKATPNASWASDYSVLQMNSTGSINGNAVAIVMANNTYYDGTNARYLTTGPASDYFQYNGSHTWRYAASGTAGAVATMVLGMTQDPAGNLGLGVTSPDRRLHVGSTVYPQLRLVYTGVQTYDIGVTAAGALGMGVAGTQAMTLTAAGNLLLGTTTESLAATDRVVSLVNGTSSSIVGLQYGGASSYYMQVNSIAAYLWNSAATPMIFGTNNAERARIDSSGKLLVGVASGIGRVVTNSGVSSSTSHGLGIAGTGNTSAYQGGYSSVRMVTINGDGGANSGNIYVAGVYGAKGVCIAAFDSSGNSVSPSATVTSSNLCTFVALVSI